MADDDAEFQRQVDEAYRVTRATPLVPWDAVARSASGPHTMVSDLAKVIIDLKSKMEAERELVRGWAADAVQQFAFHQTGQIADLKARVEALEAQHRAFKARMDDHEDWLGGVVDTLYDQGVLKLKAREPEGRP
jgi:hypothetical protein